MLCDAEIEFGKVSWTKGSLVPHVASMSVPPTYLPAVLAMSWGALSLSVGTSMGSPSQGGCWAVVDNLGYIFALALGPSQCGSAGQKPVA